MSVENKNDKSTVLELFQKMHEEKSHSTEAYSLTQPKDAGEAMKEMTQDKHTNDVYAGRTWIPAMVIHNLESKVREASIGDRTLTGGHRVIYTATGDKTIAVRCLVPQSALRHPTSIDDPIIRQYPKFTCDMNTLNSIPPVGSILMVMWNNKNIRKGGIILGYALGGQKQQDDFTIFSAPDACGEVVPSKMKTTHAAGESLPATNRAITTETKLDKTVKDEKEVESLVGTAAPNTRWATTDTPASGSTVQPKAEKKKNPQTPAEVPNINEAPQPYEPPEVVCNKSYQLSETTEEGSGVSPDQGQTRRGDKSNKFCRVEELAKRVGIPARLLLAFMEVESKGNSRAVRFEPHIFVGGIRSRNIDKARPDLRGKVPWTPRAVKGGKDRAWYISRVRKETNRAAFNKAYALDPVAAIQSTSFGQFQVMGRNLLKEFKNDAPAAMQAFDSDPEAVSDRLLITWIEGSYHWRKVAKAGAKTGNYNFIKLATYYNGAGQAEKYGKLLKDAYDRLEGKDILCRDDIPANNPRPRGDQPQRQDGLTIDMWIRGKNKGPIPAVEVAMDGPVPSARGKKGLMAASLEEPIRRMKAAYKREVPGGPALKINSLYRSYDEQLRQRRNLLKPKWRDQYNRLGGQGAPTAERWLANRAPQRKYFRVPVARPGTSNHNSGIAVDFQTSGGKGAAFKRKKSLYEQDRFYDHRSSSRRYKGKPAHNWQGKKNDTVEPWRWMALNAHRFGFIRTVASERWHYVYVGASAAAKRFSKVKKNHGSWDGLNGIVPAKEKARRRRQTQAQRRRSRG